MQETFLWARNLLIVQFCSILGLQKNYQFLSSKHWLKCFWHLLRFVKTIFVVFLSLLKLILCWIFGSSKELYLMSNTNIWLWFCEPLSVNALKDEMYYCVSFWLFLIAQHIYFLFFFFSIILICSTRLSWWVLKIKLN